ncbi:MAG: malate synthase G [Cypionkella sp.]
MTNYVTRAGLQIDAGLAAFVENDALAGTTVAPAAFWAGYASLLAELIPENQRLLAKREELQAEIDTWLKARRGQALDPAEWRQFLTEIGYLVPEGPDFSVATGPVDPEIATMAGPQLVVPVSNARFALNAANARWGSLYDALYSSDALGPKPAANGFDPDKAAQVVVWTADFLDKAVPLDGASHADATDYIIENQMLAVTTKGGAHVGLSNPAQFAGVGETSGRRAVLLKNHGLHIILSFDPTHPVGARSPSGLCDVELEGALTAIQDCEDSVTAVDAADKVAVYANWLGLMTGDLTESVTKNGRTITRRLNPDRSFVAPDGTPISLPGRAVLLVRNVGHLMTTDAVLRNGVETPEGMLDALITVTCALHDLARKDGPRNSRAGSVYIVKPKMHGPEEVAFADRLFARVEDILALPRNTVKLGVMDEERRTSANLRECIRAVKGRLVFINTGFLDRTGDEIHTCMQAGPVVPKAEMKDMPWLSAYEAGNVDAGLATGMRGRGQIGKGMWAKPDAMAEMLATKQGHPLEGANTAWVPSPTAATLHAVHYHQVDVEARQLALQSRPRASLDALLTPPLMLGRNLSAEQIAHEVDLNCQSILGYVVRWVDQGIGCSKVPDIDNVPLMEDRATLRISAQFLANWLLHGLISEAAIDASLQRMAVKVDGQNAGDPAYTPMAPGFDGQAFLAARDLILQGATQPSGYTEPLLHQARRAVKSSVPSNQKAAS